MSYEIKHAGRSADTVGNYNYEIYRSGELVARYWHDYRGDEHGIDVLNGGRFASPTGRMTDFLEGGGSAPTTLSAEAVKYLDRHIDQRR